MRGKGQLNLDRDVFLSEYWQRKPLLIKNTGNGFTPPLSSDELAGLALEEDVESRLVEYCNDTWQLRHGPFNESDFERDNPWTLLVQAVDHHIPEVAELQRLFDFIPRWRMDDVMVSYAVDGGGVGPHYDNYDVFLLQGEGHRLWRIGQYCDEHTTLLPHDELRILDCFDTREEYLLGPGDVLYVPPGVAHWGIAQGECTTFSIGFRAPRISDMLSRWTDQLLMQISLDKFYRDPGRAASTRPGELHADDAHAALAQLRSALDQAVPSQWFGELVTEPRYDVEPDQDEVAQALDLLHTGAQSADLSPAAKLAWQQDVQGLMVYANGESLNCGPSAMPALLALCDGQPLTGTLLDKALADPDTAGLLARLVHLGCIHVR
jgi:50S ribosomal protein L16 3-hydroxylase